MRLTRTSILSLFALTGLLTVSGCMHRVGDFTMVTTKNYERQTKYKMVGRMEGADKVLIILAFPLGSPDMKTAVDRAIDAGGGVYLANAVVEAGGWHAFLVGQTGYKVTGDVYASADQGDLLNPNIEKFELKEEEGSLAMVSVSTGQEVAVQDITSSYTN